MTIKEIAKIAGVSTATVSRALNEKGTVSPNALDRIQNAIASGGYSFDARRRKSAGNGCGLNRRSFAMCWLTEARIADSTAGQRIMLGMTEALRPLNTTLVVDYMDGDVNRMLESLKQQDVDGVFLFGTPVEAEILSRALGALPCVCFYHAGRTGVFDCVTPDHVRAGELALEDLVANGCRRLCCVDVENENEPENYAERRIDGFCHAARRRHVAHELIALARKRTDSAAESSRMAREAVDAFEKLIPRPDGIFVASSSMSPYIHSELKMRRIVPMRDVRMVGGDVEICGNLMAPEPVLFDVDHRMLGRLAIEAMLWRMNNPDVKKVTRMLAPDLRVPAM